MSITTQELIERLNEDLRWEYTAAVQYVQHSAVMTGAAHMGIRKELVVRAGEEVRHAIALAAQIHYLRGTPVADLYQVRTSRDNETMLQVELEEENEAIRRYVQRIQEAEELKLFHLAQQLRQILAAEQEHAMRLEEALGR
ncbi:MAG: ferritin-like domain-containing protein [bacterium]